MPYVTTFMTRAKKQLTLEDVLFGVKNLSPYINGVDFGTSTRTYEYKKLPQELKEMARAPYLIGKLKSFNRTYQPKFDANNMREHYNSFKIPKKSGGWRQIDAPDDELKQALYSLKAIFENDFKALYHTAAFAYIKGRSTTDALKVHQKNNSNWYLKTDLSNFFGSTTLEFTMRMLSMIYPFCEVVKYEDGEKALRDAISLCFLDGGLPQGTPISPLLTNVIMIPIDHEISRRLRASETNDFVYTRYADDATVSSKKGFLFMGVIEMMNDIFKKFDAPYTIKKEKTHYGSRAGRNWCLGLMINKDNKITVGHENKKVFKAMLNNYIVARKDGKGWPPEEVMTLRGKLSYYSNVEPEYFDYVISWYNKKYHCDVIKMMADDVAA